ncbi:hypothetical protein PT282_00090 [Bifidobacterium sp. ESL0763]|uniref:hypothetical protein n=1 Tax=Bifidobacterium sp. ESL0763 TaxID=2983227 RepID=UPI0023F8DDA8|nr:hypothetical protein [Bifidobacterium sp. ESL0763]MDF7663086.1 hypothetical protein [Bifidobacterium sp. ESL0763]
MKNTRRATIVASFAAFCTLFGGVGLAAADQAPTTGDAGTTIAQQAKKAASQKKAVAVSAQSDFDKSNLQTAYDAAKAFFDASGNAAQYTQRSWMDFAIDLERAKDMLNDANDHTALGASNQAAVDNMTGIMQGYPGNLQQAESGKPTGADPLKTRTDLQSLYNKVKDVQESSYTGNENWQKFNNARNSASYEFESGHASDSDYVITLAYDQLYDATKALDPNLLTDTTPSTPSVDKSALQSAYDAVKNKQESDYTAASWAPFASELAKAKALLDNASATQAQVDAEVTELNAKAAALVEASAPAPPSTPGVSKTALQTAYNKVKDYRQADFAVVGFSAFDTARTAAKAVLDNASATQAEVDAALSDLNAKAGALVDISKFNTANARFDGVDTDIHYTEFSWYNAVIAYAEAQDIKTKAQNGDALTQQDVDAVTKDINAAVDGLKAPKPGEKTGADMPTTPKTRNDLSLEVEQAEKLKQQDYTADSWSVFAEALNQAKQALTASSEMLRSNPDYTYYYVQLEDAQSALVRGSGIAGGQANGNRGGLAETGVTVAAVAGAMLLLAGAGAAVKLGSRKSE